METHDQHTAAASLDKQALRVYASLAILIYLSALGYCYSTNHLFEAGLVGVIMIGLFLFAGWIYKSI